jgi:hypothetical protein
MLNDRHVSAGWIFSKKFARFGARVVHWHRKGLAKEAVRIEAA